MLSELIIKKFTLFLRRRLTKKKLKLNSLKRFLEFNFLFHILKEDGGGPVEDITGYPNKLHLVGQENELYIRLLPKKLVITRISLKHKRQKYGTQIIQWLRSYAIKNHYEQIIIEGVFSKEMAMFCKHHGFRVIRDCAMNIDKQGFISGNYIFEI